MERTSMAMDVMTPRGKRGKNKTDSEKYHLVTRATKIIMLGDLAWRVCGCHFLFNSVHPAKRPYRQTATGHSNNGIKQEVAPTDTECKINKYGYV